MFKDKGKDDFPKEILGTPQKKRAGCLRSRSSIWLLEWFPFIQGAGDLQHRSPAFNNSGSGKGQALNTLSHSGFCFSTASATRSFSAAIYFLRIIVNTPVNAAPTSLAIVPQT